MMPVILNEEQLALYNQYFETNPKQIKVKNGFIEKIPLVEFITLRNDYIKRKEGNYSTKIYTKGDIEFCSLETSKIKALLSKTSDKNYLVFRFICSEERNNFETLTATPVYMSSDLRKNLKFSKLSFKGQGMNIDDTGSKLSNLRLRNSLLDFEEWRYEIQGIGHLIGEFKALLDSLSSFDFITFIFFIDNWIPEQRKTNIAMYFSKHLITNVDDEFNSINSSTLRNTYVYDRGQGCCP